ncbi:hypothetical protein RFI_32630 [Reticulomyxa filosa]|uniref:Uncharacterized protein n=1 Tax=Reticulomyxa filosa TaxID=46433 RepID=X6LUF4_RETFI|nr:hypothetical protein RFI_32630 [Reticulomyxa filosa]|eukprot:ETO04767.1 hypothetical protein RFI_32630 [Reticulomyxa filosa]
MNFPSHPLTFFFPQSTPNKIKLEYPKFIIFLNNPFDFQKTILRRSTATKKYYSLTNNNIFVINFIEGIILLFQPSNKNGNNFLKFLVLKKTSVEEPTEWPRVHSGSSLVQTKSEEKKPGRKPLFIDTKSAQLQPRIKTALTHTSSPPTHQRSLTAQFQSRTPQPTGYSSSGNWTKQQSAQLNIQGMSMSGNVSMNMSMNKNMSHSNHGSPIVENMNHLTRNFNGNAKTNARVVTPVKNIEAALNAFIGLEEEESDEPQTPVDKHAKVEHELDFGGDEEDLSGSATPPLVWFFCCYLFVCLFREKKKKKKLLQQ